MTDRDVQWLSKRTPRMEDGRRNDTGDRVAELLDKGMSVLEISRLLSISPQAVYKHIHKNDLVLPTKETA